MYIIISMTKLLDADSMVERRTIVSLYGSTIN